jgi:hypothetical protein
MAQEVLAVMVAQERHQQSQEYPRLMLEVVVEVLSEEPQEQVAQVAGVLVQTLVQPLHQAQ